MNETWFPVLLENGHCAINGNNIVLQNRENNEIGYAENTQENRLLFGIKMANELRDDFLTTEEVEITQDANYEIGCNNGGTAESAAAVDPNKIEWGDETKNPTRFIL
ncbi:hypothetical protein NQ315_008946 [Exocentrus adspersus]|uniref:Uncharacterized protein n=1 Tax=Exocentrus adspersus TaxID=1586481 RepID=A0AAV8V8P4_9CUCU|nr:hypothetical protein NQ315_008946 [Exocentrus adspersus]